MNKLFLLLLPLTLLLTACPAASDPNPPIPPNPPEPETVTQLGMVMLGDFSGPNTPAAANALASFNRIPETDAQRLSGNPYEAFLDTCFVTQDPNLNPPFLAPPVPIAPDTGLDAGETVTIFAGGAPYAALRRMEGEDPFYTGDGLPEGALPEAQLSVTVPGAAFPAFERVPFVNAPPVTLNEPQDPTGLSPESTFSWAPFTPADGYSAVLFSAVQVDMEDPEAFVGLACIARDDGTFSLPEETQAELQNAGFTNGSLLEFSRLATRLERSGEAVLSLQTFRQTGYYLGFLSRP